MPVVKPRITIQEVDGAPTGKPGTLKFPNTTLTDNGDGSFTYTPSVSASGQTLVTHIVAASGGTHTTLGAAIAAASNGDTIWVREGTYSESTITTSLTNITIIGEGREGSIIDLGTTTCTFSGVDVTLTNLRFNASTGSLVMSGANASIRGVDLITSGNAQHLSLTGTNFKVNDFYYYDGTSSYTTLSKINLAGNHGLMVGSYFYLQNQGGITKPSVLLAADYITVTGCTFRYRTSATNSFHIGTSSAADRCTISGCTFLGDQASLDGAILVLGTYHAITGNSITTGFYGIYTSSASYVAITGNNVSHASSGYGIHLSSSNNCAVTGNVMDSGTNGIRLEGTCSDNVIMGNRINAGTTWFRNDGGSSARNLVIGNLITSAGTVNEASVATSYLSNVGESILRESSMQRMKNTSGGTVAAGDVVVYKSVAAGDEVTTTTSGGDSKVFGMATGSISNNAYGFIQVSGKTTQLKVNGTTDIAIGDFLSTYTTAGIAKKASAAETAFAIALEAYATDDSNGVIDALIISPRLI